MHDGLQLHVLNDGSAFFSGTLPAALHFDAGRFERLWALHPSERHEIQMHGRLVRTPRWQQAYGRDYRYTGRVNRALPVPPLVEPLLDWCRQAIDTRLNGILLNWYDGSRGHYIGRHRDSTVNVIDGSPIVTISLGETRTFRLRPWNARGFVDFTAPGHSIFVMPFDTNRTWTHEVPASRRRTGRRISVTLRCIESGGQEVANAAATRAAVIQGGGI